MNIYQRRLHTSFVFGVAAACFCLCSSAPATFAQTSKKPAKPAPKNQVQGQGQMIGANGKFGTVYTLKSNFNVELLDARYTLDPLDYADNVYPAKNEKLLIVDIAVKSVNTQDTTFYTGSSFMTAVDAQGNEYKNKAVSLASRADDTGDPKLKPGQGIGQLALHDPYRVAFIVPAKARIVKLILNTGRKGSNEEVVRYYVAGATKEEAGAAGDPVNAIAALPESVRDTADTTGTTPVDVAKAPADQTVVSGPFAFHLDSFAYTTDPSVTSDNRTPGNGERYAVATITAKDLIAGKRTLDSLMTNDIVLKNADGDTVKPSYRMKAHGTTQVDYQHPIPKGETYTFRLVFPVATDAPEKSLILGVEPGRLWEYDISAAK